MIEVNEMSWEEMTKEQKLDSYWKLVWGFDWNYHYSDDYGVYSYWHGREKLMNKTRDELILTDEDREYLNDLCRKAWNERAEYQPNYYSDWDEMSDESPTWELYITIRNQFGFGK